MGFGAVGISVVLGMAMVVLPSFFGFIPRILRQVIGLASFLLVGFLLADTLLGSQVFDLAGSIGSIPVVGQVLLGLGIGVGAASIASNVVG